MVLSTERITRSPREILEIAIVRRHGSVVGLVEWGISLVLDVSFCFQDGSIPICAELFTFCMYSGCCGLVRKNQVSGSLNVIWFLLLAFPVIHSRIYRGVGSTTCSLKIEIEQEFKSRTEPRGQQKKRRCSEFFQQKLAAYFLPLLAPG